HTHTRTHHTHPTLSLSLNIFLSHSHTHTHTHTHTQNTHTHTHTQSTHKEGEERRFRCIRSSNWAALRGAKAVMVIKKGKSYHFLRDMNRNEIEPVITDRQVSRQGMHSAGTEDGAQHAHTHRHTHTPTH